MSNPVLMQIESLEDSLAKATIHPKDEEESKEDGRLTKQIKELEEGLLQMVEEMTAQIQEKIKLLKAKAQTSREDTQAIKEHLKAMREKWEGKENGTLQEKIEAFNDLNDINQRIEEIAKRLEKRGKISLSFDMNLIYQTLLQSIAVSQDEEIKDDGDFLLVPEGKFMLGSGDFIPFQLEKPLFEGWSCIQVNHKLFVCGGRVNVDQSWEYFNTFYSYDQNGKWEDLPPMSQKRMCVSLSRGTTEIIAVGGFCEIDLAKVERYFLPVKKWTKLSPLNTPRYYAGCCILHSKRSFVFCGFSAGIWLNSIESNDLSNHGEWKTLPLDSNVKALFHVAAVEISGCILVFGGFSSNLGMMKFDLEGNLLQDLSDIPNIPFRPEVSSLLVKGEKIYAISLLENNTSRPMLFDGKWSYF